MQQKDVTIIIPHLGHTKEQAYALEQCLTSLLETCECNIIVAINGISEKSTWRALDPKNPRVKVVAVEDQGQCMAVNAAAATVNTPWIFITNDDMVYAPGWFERLTEGILLSDVGLGIQCLSAKLIEPRPGAPLFETYFCGGAGGDFDKEKWLAFAKEKHQQSSQQMRTGFNFPLLIRKKLWDLIGGYDINYDPWGSNSDSDLEYKIKLAGVQPYQNPNCVVYHFSQTSGTFEPKNGSFWGKNWQYFIDKWDFPRTDQGIWEASFEIPAENKFHPEWENKYRR